MATPAPLALPPAVEQHLHADAEQCARALAAAVAESLRAGLQRRSTAALLVSGGRTPLPFFEALASQELPWSKVLVSLADDRWVAADHADSNEQLVRQHLLRGPAAAARFVPLVDAAQAPEQHLAAAERALSQLPRPYDVVVLGMGDDGHTASIFPGAPGAAEALDTSRPQRLALVTPQTAPHRRITLTLRALLDSRLLLIHLCGSGKAAVIEAAARSTPAQHPIAAILQQQSVPVHLYYSP
jgi:6-phosphogluconolactonase